MQIFTSQIFIKSARFSNNKLENKISDKKQTIIKMEEIIKYIEEIIKKKQTENNQLNTKEIIEKNTSNIKKIVEEMIIDEKKQINLTEFSVECLLEIIEFIKQEIIKSKINMMLLILTTKTKD